MVDTLRVNQSAASGLCYLHANPNKASELGRIGGRNKRSTAIESAEPTRLRDANSL